MTTSAVTARRSGVNDSAEQLVDPLMPRFGQTVTMSGLFLGIMLQSPPLIYATAGLLLIPVLSRWTIDPVAIVWRQVIGRFVGGHGERESAAPHRFAKLIGAVGTSLASGFLILGVSTVGYALAALIFIPAALGALTGFCLGCRLYRSVSLFRRLSII